MGRRWDVMEDAALRAKGHEWRNWIMFAIVARKAVPWIAAAAIVGALGFLAHWAWMAIVAGVSSTHGVAVSVRAFSAVPAWLWISGAALITLSVWMFRPGRVITPSARRMRVVQVFAVVMALAGLAGVGLFSITAGG